MIFLLKDTVTGEQVALSEQREYVVGRKNCDILLENDQSISRKHAIIRAKDGCVTLEDCKSKYHTLLNGAEVEPEVKIVLNHMDSIQFGAFNSKFCFESYSFMTAASALSADKKVALKENISRCNAKYVEKWSSNCTHLTVDKITLTIKFLQALIDEKPIVTPEYWLKYAESIENNIPPPDINLYNKPPVAEQLLKSDFQYKLDPRRKTLFGNKLFVFLKNNLKKQMEEVIKSCGGECMSWEEEGPKTFYEINTSPKEHLIIKTDNDDGNVSFNAMIKEMAKQKRRAIPLNEIALAIVHCSCEINCNPNFNKLNEVFGALTQKQQTVGILAQETQTEHMGVARSEVKIENIIPASVEDDWAMNVPNTKENQKEVAGPSGLKRLNDHQDNEGVFKKPKTEGEEKRKEKEKLSRIENTAKVQEKNDTNDKTEDNRAKDKPQLSQKRKAEEDLEKSSNKKLNPFSSITLTKSKKTKVNEEENPFELTRASSKNKLPSKGSPTKDENPFACIPSISKNTDNMVKEEIFRPRQERRKQIELIPKKSDVSFLSSVKRSLLNTTWMFKSTTSTTIKNELKEEDPGLLKIAEAFKNCVKVEVLSMINRNEKSKDGLENTSFDSIDGKKNFKKFKKVKPIKPQVTIIPRNQLTKVAPGEVIGIEISGLDSDDEAVPSDMSHIQQRTKQRVKKFVL